MGDFCSLDFLLSCCENCWHLIFFSSRGFCFSIFFFVSIEDIFGIFSCSCRFFCHTNLIFGFHQKTFFVYVNNTLFRRISQNFTQFFVGSNYIYFLFIFPRFLWRCFPPRLILSFGLTTSSLNLPLRVFGGLTGT